MALATGTVIEIRTTGSDTNGGGFNPASAGTDYSQQAAAQLSVTDAACSGTTTLTSATGGFTSAMVGNVLYLNTPDDWYQITAYTNTNTVTLDRAGPTETGMTCNVGGALASPGGLGKFLSKVAVDYMYGHIAGGTYTLTSDTENVPGGRLNFPATVFTLEGYQSTRQDLGTRPIIDAATSITSANNILDLTTGSGEGALVINLEVTNTGNTGYAFGANAAYCSSCYRCKADGGNGFKWVLPTACIAINSTIGIYGPAVGSFAKSCATGFYLLNYGSAEFSYCIASGCTTRGFWVAGADHCNLVNCIDYNCAKGVEESQNYRRHQFHNHISVNCTGTVFNGCDRSIAVNCAHYNATSGRGTLLRDISAPTLTANPFVDAANDDFRLNNTAGGGAVLRAVQRRFFDDSSYPNTLPFDWLLDTISGGNWYG